MSDALRQPDTGLHDIQKLAEEHRVKQEARERARRASELSTLKTVPPVVVLPQARMVERRTPSWVVALATLGGLAAVAAIAAGYLAVRHPSWIARMAATEDSSTKAAAAAQAPAVVPALALAPAPAPVQAPATKSIVQPVEAAVTPSTRTGRRGSRLEKLQQRAEAHERASKRASAASHATAQPENAKPAEPSEGELAEATVLGKSGEPTAPKLQRRAGGDEIDQLIADNAEAKAAAGPAPAAEEGEARLPQSPSRDAIAASMAKIKPRVAECYEKYHQQGIVNIKLGIARTGQVTSAVATGKFAGNETGACVQSAAKEATFPKFKGAPLAIDYPFVLGPR